MRFQKGFILICTFILAVQIAWSECYQLIREPAINHISIVIDRSGSMSGGPLQDAKIGAKAFVGAMRTDDRASVIDFGGDVKLTRGETSDKNSLSRAIDSIQTGGGTALYDAVARATMSLIGRDGAKIVVFLTDGSDNSSRYSIDEIRKMNVSEGVFVYGLGLGNVDKNKLRELVGATNGAFEMADDSSTLKDLYIRVLNHYYSKYGDKQADTGALVIRSIPDGREVIIDGRKVGKTPYKIDALSPSDLKVGVIYDRGIWECGAKVKTGYRTIVDSRESDLGADLLIVSSPQGASVFLDDGYIGITAIGKPISSAKPNWAEKAESDGRQLRVRKVPYGNHRFRLRAIPDFDFGPDQEIEIEIPIKDKKLILFVDIFRQKITDQNGKVYAVGRPNDPFRELEDSTDFE